MPKELCQHLRELAPPKPLTPASDPTCESTYHPDKTPHSPMVCVDWCSAHAYCAWAGKRLCGQVGGAMMVEEKLDNADTDEWYNACSNGGKTAYPYGDTFDMAACWAETPLEGKLPDDPAEPALGIYPRYPAVGERPTCRGVEPPFSGIFDMSMGAGEWMNGCWPGGSSGDMSCALRGGSYDSPPERSSCKHSSSTSQYVAYHWIGFRCCADLAAERERRHGGRCLGATQHQRPPVHRERDTNRRRARPRPVLAAVAPAKSRCPGYGAIGGSRQAQGAAKPQPVTRASEPPPRPLHGRSEHDGLSGQHRSAVHLDQATSAGRCARTWSARRRSADHFIA